jgi:ribosomal protein L12E/L44/L45/RPP1/RPP2
METTYYSLASKSSFNKALRHFFAVNDAVSEIDSKSNLADYINDLLDDEELHQDQVLPIIGAVVRDKFEYSYYSYNVSKPIAEFQKITDELIKWNTIDLLVIYFGPDGDKFIINPKSADSWARCMEIPKNYLLVVYAKYLKEKNVKLEEEAIKTFIDLLSGKDVFINKDFIDQTAVNAMAPKASTNSAPAVSTSAPGSPAPAVAAPPASGKSKKVNITPKYGVVVSNELFHNGNVEAWKKVLESYQAKYPDCKVHVMFEGEVINDINALFKWGKVKHGDSIFFQVSGEEILGVSKLQKYLYEGASQRYEQFLKLGVGKVLNLF